MESDCLEIEDVFHPSLEQGVAETSHQDRDKICQPAADSIRSDQLRQKDNLIRILRRPGVLF